MPIGAWPAKTAHMGKKHKREGVGFTAVRQQRKAGARRSCALTPHAVAGQNRQTSHNGAHIVRSADQAPVSATAVCCLGMSRGSRRTCTNTPYCLGQMRLRQAHIGAIQAHAAGHTPRAVSHTCSSSVQTCIATSTQHTSKQAMQTPSVPREQMALVKRNVAQKRLAPPCGYTAVSS